MLTEKDTNDYKDKIMNLIEKKYKIPKNIDTNKLALILLASTILSLSFIFNYIVIYNINTNSAVYNIMYENLTFILAIILTIHTFIIILIYTKYLKFDNMIASILICACSSIFLLYFGILYLNIDESKLMHNDILKNYKYSNINQDDSIAVYSCVIAVGALIICGYLVSRIYIWK